VRLAQTLKRVSSTVNNLSFKLSKCLGITNMNVCRLVEEFLVCIEMFIDNAIRSSTVCIVCLFLKS
jgi:hypothetical protein